MERRDFIKSSGAVLTSIPLMGFGLSKPLTKKMIVLGFDGMDHGRIFRLLEKGELPNIARLIRNGSISGMGTTIPPQSPVAWGSFITGSDPGTYGLFDFVHRDPSNYFPIPSHASTFPAGMNVRLGKYQIPLKPGRVVLNREGKAFWDYLEDRGIEATIFKIPSNYPPSKSKHKIVSGMGTPDIVGGNGEYTLFTSDEQESQKDVFPNRIYYAFIDENGVMEGEIEGPINDLIDEPEPVSLPFKVYVDEAHKTARIDIQGHEILIAENEYSDWVELKFPLINGISSIAGMVKFFLLEMGSRFRLYISPVHISPRDPAIEISTPSSYSRKLVNDTGLFHTIGLPSDTKALDQNIFDMEQFITQSMSVYDESRRIYHYELDKFIRKNEGLLFFYFSTLDQGQHMFWVLNDKGHPYYNEEQARRYGHVTDEYYRLHDKIVGETLEKVDPNTPIMVLSDHGFTSYRRSVNLNTWLHKEGYLKLHTRDIPDNINILENNDEFNLAETRAYYVGLNGLYLNLRGREGEGIVEEKDRRRLLEEIKGKLELLRDPANGERVVSTAFISEDVFSKDHLNRGPDIVVGYNRGYRAGSECGWGGLVSDIVRDNMKWWSGDHCIDPQWVPACFLSNFKTNGKTPHLKDMAPTILKFFGIETPSEMSGSALI